MSHHVTVAFWVTQEIKTKNWRVSYSNVPYDSEKREKSLRDNILQNWWNIKSLNFRTLALNFAKSTWTKLFKISLRRHMYVIDPAYFSLFEATCKQGKCNFRTLGVDVESRSMQVIWRDEKGGAILGSRIYMCFLCAIVKNLSFAWHFNNKWKNCFLRHCRKNSNLRLLKTTSIFLSLFNLWARPKMQGH